VAALGRTEPYNANTANGSAWPLSRRPQDQIKGPKPLWVGISFINTIGPLAYFSFGRKRHLDEAGSEADSLTADASPTGDFPVVNGSPAAEG